MGRHGCFALVHAISKRGDFRCQKNRFPRVLWCQFYRISGIFADIVCYRRSCLDDKRSVTTKCGGTARWAVRATARVAPTRNGWVSRRGVRIVGGRVIVWRHRPLGGSGDRKGGYSRLRLGIAQASLALRSACTRARPYTQWMGIDGGRIVGVGHTQWRGIIAEGVRIVGGIHEQVLRRLRIFLVVGGMPAVVARYCEQATSCGSACTQFSALPQR